MQDGLGGPWLPLPYDVLGKHHSTEGREPLLVLNRCIQTEDSRAIHSLVLIDRPKDRGVYRKIPVRIMGAETELVQPYMIEPKMQDLLRANEKRKKAMHPIERIARFHLEFECIHPYIGSNGRTGRLIANLDLI